MKFKGTPGKWSIENLHNPENGRYSAQEIIISTKDDEVMCTVWYCKSFGKKICKEQKANALLISKAPEMLDFLIELFNDKETYSEMFPSQQQKLEQLIKESTKLK